MGSKNNKKVIVGMSGGVDSSVAAALLVKQGYSVSGVTMKTWDGGRVGHSGGCFGPGQMEAIENARRVADILGIAFHVIDLVDEFRGSVLDYFCLQYLSGNTPNPCVRCNRFVKFGVMWEKALAAGIEADFFASGHYAGVEQGASGRYLLKKAKDGRKDQSYFLYSLTQQQLARTLFPLGGYLKQEVRQLSMELGLGLEARKESQDFAGGDYAALFEGKAVPGQILDRQGRVLGMHKGIVYFTRGQRRGLDVATGEPLYVIDILADSNEVVVGGMEELSTEKQIVHEVNWIALESLGEPPKVSARIRSSHPGYAAVISQPSGDEVSVKYMERQVGAAPGQSIVFYSGDVVVGGGTAK
jgi:tRNA-uridine 2-sulfurtransferase